MKHLIAAAVIALSPLAVAAQGTPVEPTEAYDLLFRTGTLDDVPRGGELVYDRTVTNALTEVAAMRDTGEIALGFEAGAEGRPESAVLTFRQDGGHRMLGSFPASVGNPMIMYFYESTVRDMGESAGGSPFYIRNRVKDALATPAPIEDGTATWNGQEIDVKRVTLRPFEGDPNADRMQGFGDLALTVTMSEEVPGWYLSLVAEAAGEGEPIYRSEIALEGVE